MNYCLISCPYAWKRLHRGDVKCRRSVLLNWVKVWAKVTCLKTSLWVVIHYFQLLLRLILLVILCSHLHFQLLPNLPMLFYCLIGFLLRLFMSLKLLLQFFDLAFCAVFQLMTFFVCWTHSFLYVHHKVKVVFHSVVNFKHLHRNTVLFNFWKILLS